MPIPWAETPLSKGRGESDSSRPLHSLAATPGFCYSVKTYRENEMIYCVVPPELGEDTFGRLVEHYKDNPSVKVILERRRSERRAKSPAGAEHPARALRDRRQKTRGSSEV